MSHEDSPALTCTRLHLFDEVPVLTLQLRQPQPLLICVLLPDLQAERADFFGNRLDADVRERIVGFDEGAGQRIH